MSAHLRRGTPVFLLFPIHINTRPSLERGTEVIVHRAEPEHNRVLVFFGQHLIACDPHWLTTARTDVLLALAAMADPIAVLYQHSLITTDIVYPQIGEVHYWRWMQNVLKVTAPPFGFEIWRQEGASSIAL